VRADLGQVEPRVLAAASGDRGLATAAEADDLYLPVAERLGVDRKIAKVAVLAAMYGQTSGAAGAALEQMTAAYPVALRFLKAAEQAGRDNRSIRTYGGRLVRLGPLDPQLSGEARRSVVAGRGRFLRNAAVQGAAAEFFKAWVATVRTHLRGRGELVMCLHDELLVHARADVADEVCELVRRDLDVTGARWFPNARVRFVADIAALDCWADAKD
jgi:DNA polymerase-1